MSEAHYIIGKIYDPEFKVDTIANYQTLIGYLSIRATEYLDEHPEVDPRLVWVTYISKNWEQE